MRSHGKPLRRLYRVTKYCLQENLAAKGQPPACSVGVWVSQVNKSGGSGQGVHVVEG